MRVRMLSVYSAYGAANSIDAFMDDALAQLRIAYSSLAQKGVAGDDIAKKVASLDALRPDVHDGKVTVAFWSNGAKEIASTLSMRASAIGDTKTADAMDKLPVTLGAGANMATAGQYVQGTLEKLKGLPVWVLGIGAGVGGLLLLILIVRMVRR